jgi:hypothetical protein
MCQSEQYTTEEAILLDCHTERDFFKDLQTLKLEVHLCPSMRNG